MTVNRGDVGKKFGYDLISVPKYTILAVTYQNVDARFLILI